MTKIIFFGTPDYVIPILESLHKYYKIVAVVTQPPKLVGRKQLKTFSPTDNWAHKKKIPIFTSQFSGDDLPKADLGVVASYGKIISQEVINHFKYGILNIHPSILPKYRGASPIQSQIINGETKTGVSVIKMDAKMDHGPIISVLRDEITDEDTNETLRNRLFEKSAQFLVDLIPNYISQKVLPKKQSEDEATFTKIIGREDGLVDLKKDDPKLVEKKFRALSPWPGIYVIVSGKRVKLINLHLEENKLVLDRVQLEGKKSVSYNEFKLGHPELEL